MPPFYTPARPGAQFRKSAECPPVSVFPADKTYCDTILGS
jgi:hypothetical protein